MPSGPGIYAVGHFAITTDINKLISPNLDWRQHELAYEAAFPGPFTSILVVVDAPTPERASEATNKLVERLAQQPKLFHSARQLDGGPFFAKNGLLFQSESELARTTEGLIGAAPIIGTLASDPTLRGLTRALSFGLIGVQTGGVKLNDLIRPLTMSADTVDQVLAGQPASFSWHVLLSGQPPGPKELRHFIDVRPVLDFTALEPGRAASDAIRKAVETLKLGPGISGARAPDRAGGDGGRRIRHRAGRRAGQRHRHGRRRADHPLARLALGAHHRGRRPQSVRRPRGDRGAGAAGWWGRST